MYQFFYRLSASLSSVLINIDKLPPPPEEVTADIHTVPNIFNIKPQNTESSEEIVTRRDSIVPNKKMKKSTEPDTVISTSRQNGFVCNAQLKGPLSPLPSVTSSQNGSVNHLHVIWFIRVWFKRVFSSQYWISWKIKGYEYWMWMIHGFTNSMQIAYICQYTLSVN